MVIPLPLARVLLPTQSNACVHVYRGMGLQSDGGRGGDSWSGY